MKLSRYLTLGIGAAAAVFGAAMAARNGSAADATIAPAPAKPALTVAIATPQLARLPLKLTANGNVAAWDEASIGAEADGLRLAEVRVAVGDVVRRGQVLAVFASATIDADLANIQASVAEAEASAAEAAANAARARSLRASGALSEQHILQLTTADETARARLAAQRATLRREELRLAKTQVIAPDDGIVSAKDATIGAVVPAGKELFRLIRQSRIEWRADVTADDVRHLAPGMSATVTTPDGKRVTGTVRVVAPTVDRSTRLALVYVDLPREATLSGLRAGMFATGEFELGISDALTVPQQAIVVRDGFSYVFRLDGNRVYQLKVRTGRRLGDAVEIFDLPAAATLIATGAGFLNDGDVVKVVS